MANAFIITAAHWDVPGVKTVVALSEEVANTWAAKMVGELIAERPGDTEMAETVTAADWHTALADLQRAIIAYYGDAETAESVDADGLDEASDFYVRVEAVPLLEAWPSPVTFTPGPVDHAAIADAIRAEERPLIVDSSHMSNGDVERMVEGMRAGGAKIPVLEYGQPITVTSDKARIIVTIDQGIAEVHCDNIDLTNVALVMVDYDTEGSGADEGVVDFGATKAFVSVGTIGQADDELARDARRAVDTWALS